MPKFRQRDTKDYGSGRLNRLTKEIDHEYTRNIICPYCGYEFTDSWDIESNEISFEWTCCECENDFNVERHEIVEYSTEKIGG